MNIERRIAAPRVARTVVAALLALAVTPAAHAVDIFLQFDALLGESTDKTFKDAIDVLEFGENIVGKNCPRFTITKNIDRATPGLADFVNKGTVAATAALSVRQTGSPFVYYSVAMENVTVLSIQPEIAHSDLRGDEVVVLSARKATLKYTVLLPDGRPGTSVSKVITCVSVV